MPEKSEHSYEELFLAGWYTVGVFSNGVRIMRKGNQCVWTDK